MRASDTRPCRSRVMVARSLRLARWSARRPSSSTTLRSNAEAFPQVCPSQPDGTPFCPSGPDCQSSTTTSSKLGEEAGPDAPPRPGWAAGGPPGPARAQSSAAIVSPAATATRIERPPTGRVYAEGVIGARLRRGAAARRPVAAAGEWGIAQRGLRPGERRPRRPGAAVGEWGIEQGRGPRAPRPPLPQARYFRWPLESAATRPRLM